MIIYTHTTNQGAEEADRMDREWKVICALSLVAVICFAAYYVLNVHPAEPEEERYCPYCDNKGYTIEELTAPNDSITAPYVVPCPHCHHQPFPMPPYKGEGYDGYAVKWW